MNIKKVSSALLAAYNAAAAFVKAYPGGIAGATTAVVALAATFGLHVTVNELASIVSAVAVVAGILVHLNTVPKPAKPAAPVAPTPPKMGVTAQSNFTSTAVPLTAPSNTSHDIAQSTNMGGSSSSSAGSSDQLDTSWSSGAEVAGATTTWIAGSSASGFSTAGSSGNSSLGAHSMTIAATGGSNGSGEMATWNTGAQSAGTAHTHPMDHYHDVSHTHYMDHYHNSSHNHTMSHDHYYGAQQVTDFNELRDTVTSFFAMFSELSANLTDYQNLVNRVNGMINHDNQGGATKLWECLGA